MIALREIRCPGCGKKLAEGLEGGILYVTCRCGKSVVIDRRT
jgi:phage FluMu protein Com